MNSATKRLAACLALLLFGLPVLAGQFACQWNSADFVGGPLSNTYVYVTTIAPYGVDGDIIINRTRIRYTNDSTGQLIVSNLFNGRSYRVEFEDSRKFEVMTITNSFDTNVTGLVNGANPAYLTAPIRDGNTTAHSQNAADARFVHIIKSNGVTVATAASTLNFTNASSVSSNAGTVTVGLPSGGSGSSLAEISAFVRTNAVSKTSNYVQQPFDPSRTAISIVGDSHNKGYTNDGWAEVITNRAWWAGLKAYTNAAVGGTPTTGTGNGTTNILYSRILPWAYTNLSPGDTWICWIGAGVIDQISGILSTTELIYPAVYADLHRHATSNRWNLVISRPTLVTVLHTLETAATLPNVSVVRVHNNLLARSPLTNMLYCVPDIARMFPNNWSTNYWYVTNGAPDWTHIADDKKFLYADIVDETWRGLRPKFPPLFTAGTEGQGYSWYDDETGELLQRLWGAGRTNWDAVAGTWMQVRGSENGGFDGPITSGVGGAFTARPDSTAAGLEVWGRTNATSQASAAFTVGTANQTPAIKMFPTGAIDATGDAATKASRFTHLRIKSGGELQFTNSTGMQFVWNLANDGRLALQDETNTYAEKFSIDRNNRVYTPGDFSSRKGYNRTNIFYNVGTLGGWGPNEDVVLVGGSNSVLTLATAVGKQGKQLTFISASGGTNTIATLDSTQPIIFGADRLTNWTLYPGDSVSLLATNSTSTLAGWGITASYVNPTIMSNALRSLISAGAVTNAIASVSSNGTSIATGATNLNFVGATVTNASGNVTVIIPAGGALSDGDYGDITVSSSGTVMSVDSGAVLVTEIGGGSQGKLVGRANSGVGNLENINLSSDFDIVGGALTWIGATGGSDPRFASTTATITAASNTFKADVFVSKTNYTDRVEATNSSSLILYGGGAELQLTSGGVYTPSSGGFSGKGDLLTFDDEAYDATGWNGDTTAPTKNAVRDKIEALSIGATDPRWASSAGTMTAASNTVAATTFSGALSGNATTATTATSVADADKGDISISSGVWSIDSGAVTFAKFQNINDARLLGRSAGSSGVMQEITVGSGLSLSGGALTATGGGGGGATFPLTNNTVLLTNNGDFGVDVGISLEREWNSGTTSNLALNFSFNALVASIYQDNLGNLTFDTHGNVHHFNQSVSVAGDITSTVLAGTGNRTVYADPDGNFQPGVDIEKVVQTNDSRNLSFSGTVNTTGSNHLAGVRRDAGAVMTTYETNLTGANFQLKWAGNGMYIRTSNSFNITAVGTPYEGSQYTVIITNCVGTNVWGTNDFNSFDAATRQTGGVFLCPALSETTVKYVYRSGLYRFYSEYGPNSVPLSMLETNNGVLITNIVNADTLTIPMGAWWTNNVGNGADTSAASAQSVTNTGDAMCFTDAVTNSTRTRFALPKNWNGGTVNVILETTSTATNGLLATNSVFAVTATAITNGARLDNLTFPADTWITNKIGTTAYTAYTSVSSPVTVGGANLSPTNSILWRIHRLGAATGDTTTNVVCLTEVRIAYQINTSTNFPSASP